MKIAGYEFKNERLLKQALTHPSHVAEQGGQHYERLEFLGDAVLGLAVSEFLYMAYTEEKEGALAKRRAGLVCGQALAEVAQQIKLDKAMKLGVGEESSGGRKNPTNLENVMEAVAGAMYLDGGMEPIRMLVDQYISPLAEVMTEPPKDPKTQLQEWAQAEKYALPRYELIKQDGPAHAPSFTVSVQVENYPLVEGHGTSKRLAERDAAERFLEQQNLQQAS